MAAGAVGWLPLNLSWWSGIGAFAPALVGMAVAGREGGVDAVRDMLQRADRWRVGVGWYVLALLFRAGPGVLTVRVVAVPTSSPLHLGATDPGAILGLSAALLVFNFAEAIGWTGFAYLRLRRLFGQLVVLALLPLYVLLLWVLAAAIVVAERWLTRPRFERKGVM